MVRVKTAEELRELVERGLRIDPNDNKRKWTKAEVFYAINTALRSWDNRVLIPYVYDPGTNYDNNSYSVALPQYINPRFIRPQWRRYLPHVGSSNSGETETWVNMPGFTTEPDGSGGNNLRLLAIPYNVEWRVMFWHGVGEIPSTTLTISGTMTASDTSLTIGEELWHVAECGMVRVGTEWMVYKGKSVGSSTTTLSNLERGAMNTTPAAHTSGDRAYIGVPADDARLYDQLVAYASHSLYAMLGAESVGEDEYQRRERQMRIWRQTGDEFWSTYSGTWQPMMRLDINALTPWGM